MTNQMNKRIQTKPVIGWLKDQFITCMECNGLSQFELIDVIIDAVSNIPRTNQGVTHLMTYTTITANSKIHSVIDKQQEEIEELRKKLNR